MKKIDDNDLLKEFEIDKERAFKIFFDSYYMRLCMYAVQITDDFTEAEDIVQNFFVQFWENKLYLKIKSNLKNYVYLSIRNAAIKSVGKNEMVSLNRFADDELIFLCEELEDLERDQKEKELKKALDELPEQERKALFSVVLENKKYKEAAEELQISVNTLKTHLGRDLKRLRANDKLIWLIVYLLQHTSRIF